MSNPRQYYEYLIASIPEGLERVVFEILSKHIGIDNAIKKQDLMAACTASGANLKNERQIRAVIVNLRKVGVPVCSSSGESGYFLSSSLSEYSEFRGREYVKKIVDMRETVDAMDIQIKRMFPADYAAYQQEKAARAGQPSLI